MQTGFAITLNVRSRKTETGFTSVQPSPRIDCRIRRSRELRSCAPLRPGASIVSSYWSSGASDKRVVG